MIGINLFKSSKHIKS